MAGQQGARSLTASNRPRKSKGETRAMGVLVAILLVLIVVFALIVQSVLGLLSGGSGEDQDPGSTEFSTTTTSVEPEEPASTGENVDSQQENGSTEPSDDSTSEGTGSGSAEDQSSGGDG